MTGADEAEGVARIRDVFPRFRRLVEDLLPDNAPFLPGASQDDLTLLEWELGFPVPPELRAMLELANGQDRRVALDGPIQWARLLSVDEVASTYRFLSEAVSDMAVPAVQPSHYSYEVISPGWVPFAELADCFWCLDMSPGSMGVAGQVFYLPNVPDLSLPEAVSLSAFLTRFCDGVADGSFEVSEGTFLLPLGDRSTQPE